MCVCVVSMGVESEMYTCTMYGNTGKDLGKSTFWKFPHFPPESCPPAKLVHCASNGYVSNSSL